MGIKFNLVKEHFLNTYNIQVEDNVNYTPKAVLNVPIVAVITQEVYNFDTTTFNPPPHLGNFYVINSNYQIIFLALDKKLLEDLLNKLLEDKTVYLINASFIVKDKEVELMLNFTIKKIT